MRKRIIALLAACFLTGSLILSNVQPVQAGIFDFAMGKLRYTATVAEIVVSLLAGSGAAVTNTSYLNQLNSAYGIESSIGTITGTDGTLGAMYEAGLFSVDTSGAFIDNGLVAAIESVPEYQTLGISDYMATWATEGGVETVATSAAENIGSSIGAASAFGTLCQVAGAVGMGVELGVLANRFINWAGKKMAASAPINTADSIMQHVPIGYRLASAQWYRDSNYTWYPFYEAYPSNYCIPVINTDNNFFGGLNYSPNYQVYYYVQNRITGQWDQTTIAPRSTALSNSYDPRWWRNMTGYIPMTSSQIDSIKSGGSSPDPYKPYSPDVVGKNGNQRSTDYTQPLNPQSWPDIGDQTPEGKGIQAIPWNDYQDFVTDVNYNTTNNNTTIQQGDTYNNFVTNYYVTPEAIETGETVTNPDYNPTVPEQPNPNEKPEVNETEAQQNTDYMTTPGLKDVFPFCIPWDLKALFGLFNSGLREAPKITIPFTSELYDIDEDVTIDFSTFDAAAAILRTLELIGFAVGLAMATRSLIGAR